MAKYGIGESVRFKAPELLVSTGGYSIKIDTDGLVGRVTCSIETTGEETKYRVDVKFPRGLPVSASGILGISASDVTLKLDVLESQLQSEKVKNGRKFERCLRDSVVDEALERAIELLKGGTE